MKVLITGGIGNVGTAVIERFAAAGHEVRVIGRRAGMRVTGAEYGSCDVTDIECLKGHARGMDAIVHLAALGNPAMGAPEEVFRVNCQGTFNVYEAAERNGIRRVVTASSINALGFGFGVRDFSVHYLPIDEEHPTMPTDAYSFSKNVGEDIASYFWRREGISGCCLRIPATAPFPHYEEKAIRDFAARCRAEADELMSLGPNARRARIDGWMERLAEGRRQRIFERPPRDWKGLFPESSLMGCRADLWTAVDARDSAQAFERAVTRDYEGSHVLYINDGCNRTGVPSETLVELFYPGFAAWRKRVTGLDALVSIDTARSLLEYEPEYSARRFLS
jgi:nucleoside-diphosphate-sugar epimerase